MLQRRQQENIEKLGSFVSKGGFFSESAIRFSNLQISKKNIFQNYPELEIEFKIPTHNIILLLYGWDF